MPLLPQHSEISTYQRLVARRSSVASGLTSGVAVVVCTAGRPASLHRFLRSLATQASKPEQLIIVDASLDDHSERMLRHFQGLERLAADFQYFRVSAPLRGLTRQRNFSLQWVTTELVAFFDDDISLMPDCLCEMERAYRSAPDDIVGVGAFVQDGPLSSAPALLWRVRHLLRILPSLRPGRYHRSGVSVPWLFLNPTNELVEGDWLPGCAMMWRTEEARAVGFYEAFDGYALGEDLDFSLRMRAKGRLVIAGAARVLHFIDPKGRPSAFETGYMSVYNRYQIHRRAFPDRTRSDRFWFGYSWILDTLLLARFILSPSKSVTNLFKIAGRLKAGYDIARGR
jgi:GT2 family glycosyltransferase